MTLTPGDLFCRFDEKLGQRKGFNGFIFCCSNDDLADLVLFICAGWFPASVELASVDELAAFCARCRALICQET